MMYFTGMYGLKQDDGLAAKWLKRAADARLAPAEAAYGALLRDGRGVEKDEKLSVTYLQRALDKAPFQGADAARCHLDVAYLTGTGVTRDEKRGRRLLSVAMKHGHADAAKLLAQVDTALEIAEAATPNTKAEYLAKLDEACASDDDPELRKAVQVMKGMLESRAGTGGRANAKKKVNPKKRRRGAPRSE